MAKKKPKRPQRRVPLEKKPRKPSSLLRRLSGKRTTNDIVPGSSSQKQTFIPRSVSSQDGGMLQATSAAPNTLPTTTCTATTTKRMSDVGLREENRSPLVSSRPSSLRGLKHIPPLPMAPVPKMPTSPIPVSPLARTDATATPSTSNTTTTIPEPLRVKRFSLFLASYKLNFRRSPSPAPALNSSSRSLMSRLLHKDDSS